jgi:hypothetical protein
MYMYLKADTEPWQNGGGGGLPYNDVQSYWSFVQVIFL